jgi:hypothetical protein
MIIIVGICSVVTVVAVVVVATYCIAIRDFVVFRGIGVRA